MHIAATRGPPNSAMFSGYQSNPPLPTEGPVKHPDPFDPVKSFQDKFRGVAWDSNITNKVMGSCDPSFWPAQFACLSQIPTSGPFWKLDPELGTERWASGERLETKAPDSSFTNLNLPDPPYVQLMDGQDQSLSFRCPNCNTDNLDAGQLQYHLNRFHSNWKHRCQHCHKVQAHNFFQKYLRCDHVDCARKRERFTEKRDLDEHRQQHIPLEERSPPKVLLARTRLIPSAQSALVDQERYHPLGPHHYYVYFVSHSR